MKTPRATFSKEEDLKITSLQKKHGNQWKLITERINETFETEWSNEQVRRWFLQLEIERKQGGRKLRRVDFSEADDAQLVALRDKWIKKNKTTYGMWKAIVAKMPGKNEYDLRNRWRSKLSQSSAVTSTASTSTAMTSTAESTKAVSLKVVAKKVTATKVAATKVAAKKVAATKVAGRK